jgi:phosphoribosylformylglycinamidine synthase
MIYRIDVKTTGADSAGEHLRQQIRELGWDLGPIRSARIFLLDAHHDVGTTEIRDIARRLLADPIVETGELIDAQEPEENVSRIEVHLKPGVMDPVAASTEMAIRDMGIDISEVRTGRAFVFQNKVDQEKLKTIATRLLANGVIETVHFDRYIPKEFPVGHEHAFFLRHVSMRELNDDALKKLSREGHLFLSLTEMKAIQSYYRQQQREPTDVELETLAQTWSEHCVHKTLKSGVEVFDESGKSVKRYGNLIKDTIFKATQELMNGEPASAGGEANGTKGAFCLSVFKDNAGVIAFDDEDAVCFKVETHNHPSAIEPYGGSATGVGGVIRDVLGTGLAAKPIANTDVFCVAYPDAGSSIANRKSQIANLPKGVIHPKRILQQVVAGVRDYGNRMGIPTINGAVYFDDRYLGNPLVFCGCVGLIPRDKIAKQSNAGDAIVLMGGRTGRDGIHGATFSSAELTDTHADEFSHAVQIGNAITEKKVADVILQARDRNLFSAITDLGAGGLSSAVGEMGEKLGANVELDKVPLKYAGLRYDEIWISEAQERMLLSVPKEHVDAILKLANGEDVEATVIGTFGTENHELILHYRGHRVGSLSMQFLHEGLPMPTRRAVVPTKKTHGKPAVAFKGDLRQKLLDLLAHPNVASKHWIIRQYDHEVQGGSVVKPLIGPEQIGPSDASVIRPKHNSTKGVVIACGLAPAIEDPYQMTIAAIDEAVRNAVAIGADPTRLAILDNFCWPSVDDERTMGTLVAACEACYDASKAYGIPFISGKDSLHNQFTNQETGEVLKIPNTLLISAIGVIDDVRKCITMDLKGGRNNVLALIKPRTIELSTLAKTHRAVAGIIAAGHVQSCHDISDGGLLVAAAEMCIASGFGLELDATKIDDPFGETPGRYLIEIDPQGESEISSALNSAGADVIVMGKVTAVPATLEVGSITSNRTRKVDLHLFVDEMTKAWRGTLDW